MRKASFTDIPSKTCSLRVCESGAPQNPDPNATKRPTCRRMNLHLTYNTPSAPRRLQPRRITKRSTVSKKKLIRTNIHDTTISLFPVRPITTQAVAKAPSAVIVAIGDNINLTSKDPRYLLYRKYTVKIHKAARMRFNGNAKKE